MYEEPIIEIEEIEVADVISTDPPVSDPANEDDV